MRVRDQKLLKFYEQMLLVRRFEEAAAKAYAGGKIKGFCHLYIGEESVAVGAIGALEARDYVIGTYREHGHALAKGLSSRSVMAELFGKVTGCSQGMGGSMHLFNRELNFMGGHGIVGGHVALASGIAFGSRYKKERAVTLCFMGEGATNIGGFYEGLTYASLWSLPVVFIVENNLYAMGTPLHRSQPLEDISQKAAGFGMPGIRFDAFDVMQVYDTIKEAVNRARADRGPTLVEAITYRYRGHSMSDPAKYRPLGELENMKQRDPLDIAKTALAGSGIEENVFTEIENRVKAEVADAVDFAENSDFPPLSHIHNFSHV